ncbi:MAG TPA: DoxX family protein [bacterium]|nr:DoxX family protein [bacterium]
MWRKILHTDAERATILIRLMVGAVFLSEGYQKFLFPFLRGVGRFERIGIPAPEFFGYFVAGFEVACGLLILFGLFTRLASIPLITIMIVAIYSTKLPVLIDQGIWHMLHDGRTDYAMFLGSIFLLLKGGGRWSLDRKLTERFQQQL